MTKLEMDVEDAALAVAFTLAAASSVGIVTVDLFNLSLQDSLIQLGSTTITFATAISAGALAITYYTNDSDLSDLKGRGSDLLGIEDGYYYAVIGTAALVVAMAFVPSVESFVTSNDLYALIAVVVQSAGFGAIGYIA